MTQQYPSSPDSAATREGFLNRLPHRSRQDRILGGVCGGLAREWGRPAWHVRAAIILLALLPGPMWVAYLLAWIAMPEEPASQGTGS